jgi:hypothetical protein
MLGPTAALTPAAAPQHLVAFSNITPPEACHTRPRRLAAGEAAAPQRPWQALSWNHGPHTGGVRRLDHVQHEQHGVRIGGLERNCSERSWNYRSRVQFCRVIIFTLGLSTYSCAQCCCRVHSGGDDVHTCRPASDRARKAVLPTAKPPKAAATTARDVRPTATRAACAAVQHSHAPVHHRAWPRSLWLSASLVRGRRWWLHFTQKPTTRGAAAASGHPRTGATTCGAAGGPEQCH